MKHFTGIIVFSFAVFAGGAEEKITWKSELPEEVDIFYNECLKHIDAEIEKSKALAESTDSKVPQLQKDEAKAKLQSLTDFKKGLDNVEKVRALYNSTRDSFKEVDGILSAWEKENSRLHIDGGTVIPSEINASRLEKIRKFGVSGYNWYQKASDLKSKLDNVNTYEYSPETGRMAKALTTLSSAMSEFGDKIPLIGDFIKGYGDITSAFLDMVGVLGGRIKEARNQDMMGTGTYDQWRNQAWRDQKIEAMADRVQGTRDLYQIMPEEVSSGHPWGLYLWDPETERDVNGEKKKGRWWEVHKLIPGVKPEDIVRRYEKYFSAGIRSPTAQQILMEFSKAIEVILAADSPGVPPGQKLVLHPLGIRSMDGTPVTEALRIRVFDDSGKAIECVSGKTVEWEVPKEFGAYEVKAALTEESKQVWKELRAASLEYYVGQETVTRIAISPEPIKLTRSDPVPFVVSVKLKENDQVLDRGTLRVRLEPLAGRFPKEGYGGGDLSQGNLHFQWVLPENPKAGKYTLHAEYEGAISKASGYFITPSRDSKEITIAAEEPAQAGTKAGIMEEQDALEGKISPAGQNVILAYSALVSAKLKLSSLEKQSKIMAEDHHKSCKTCSEIGKIVLVDPEAAKKAKANPPPVLTAGSEYIPPGYKKIEHGPCDESKNMSAQQQEQSAVMNQQIAALSSEYNKIRESWSKIIAEKSNNASSIQSEAYSYTAKLRGKHMLLSKVNDLAGKKDLDGYRTRIEELYEKTDKKIQNDEKLQQTYGDMTKISNVNRPAYSLVSDIEKMLRDGKISQEEASKRMLTIETNSIRRQEADTAQKSALSRYYWAEMIPILKTVLSEAGSKP